MASGVFTLTNACLASISGAIYCSDLKDDVRFPSHPTWPVCRVEQLEASGFPSQDVARVVWCTGKPKELAPCVGDAKECALQY